MKRNSIRYRFFMVIIAIMVFNILVTLFFGTSLMEKLYTISKENELKLAYQNLTSQIPSAEDFDLTNSDITNAIFEAEKDNTTLLLFSLENQTAYIHYYSRSNFMNERPATKNTIPATIKSVEIEKHFAFSPIPQYSPADFIKDAQLNGVFTSETFPLVMKSNEKPWHSINLYGKTADNLYIFLTTPQKPLTFAANLAVQYNLYISLATFVLAAILTFFVTKRFTQPIADIDQAAQRISQMDFSKRCEIKTGDELEDLSNSINIMAEKLKAYIDQLELNQSLLEKDLAREAKTNALRKEFIANVSHDFKTPLTLIQAYTEALSDNNLSPEEKQEYRDIILKESQRMNLLVTQLLQLSKLESGIATLEISIFPLEEMMREILHQNQLLIKEKNLAITILPAEDHFASGDYNRIMQVMVNLIENAVKYTTPNGAVTLDVLEVPNNKYRITITNTAPHFTEEEIDHLFISFYRQDQSRQNDSKNFGLGLAIIKATMLLHNESCGAQNVDAGVQFYFELPAVKNI